MERIGEFGIVLLDGELSIVGRASTLLEALVGCLNFGFAGDGSKTFPASQTASRSDAMRWTRKNLGVALGLIVGLGLGLGYRGVNQPVWAMVDRHEETIMCTGPVQVLTGQKTDGLWMLDYRTGRLIGSIIDRNTGKVSNWAEVDLVNEFGAGPRNNVHFMMVTGQVTQGQAALYLAETVSGKFGVYSMGPRTDGQPGMAIRRHDMTTFRPKTP